MGFLDYPQGSVVRPLLFILYTFELFHIVGYADDSTNYETFNL